MQWSRISPVPREFKPEDRRGERSEAGITRLDEVGDRPRGHIPEFAAASLHPAVDGIAGGFAIETGNVAHRDGAHAGDAGQAGEKGVNRQCAPAVRAKEVWMRYGGARQVVQVFGAISATGLALEPAFIDGEQLLRGGEGAQRIDRGAILVTSASTMRIVRRKVVLIVSKIFAQSSKSDGERRKRP